MTGALKTAQFTLIFVGNGSRSPALLTQQVWEVSRGIAGRLVGVSLGLIRNNRSNRVKVSAAYMAKRKPCIFNIYCFGKAFLMKHNASIVESSNETWVCSKESTYTECHFCCHRSGLDHELHSELKICRALKSVKLISDVIVCPVIRQKHIPISGSKKTPRYSDSTILTATPPVSWDGNISRHFFSWFRLQAMKVNTSLKTW